MDKFKEIVICVGIATAWVVGIFIGGIALAILVGGLFYFFGDGAFFILMIFIAIPLATSIIYEQRKWKRKYRDQNGKS